MVIEGIDQKEIMDNLPALMDLLQGDMGVFKEQLQGVDLDKLQIALQFILENEKLSDSQKNDLLANSWRVNYREKPPTPEEFLTSKYIGRMEDHIYPRVKKWFLEFFDESKPYRNAVLYPFIGAGKSTLAVLINLYICTHMALMRDPKKYLNQAPSAILTFALCSYNMKKATEVLLEPFINLLEVSDFFIKMRTREDMIRVEKQYQDDHVHGKIFWTTASMQGASAMQFSNGMHFKLISSVQNLLGLTIVCGTMTELAFFREAGKGDDYIMRFFNDLKRRIDSRMKGNYWGRSILDSSPNDLESPVDKYCMFEADKDDLNYVVKGSRWDWVAEDYKFINDRFPVFKGGNGKPPTILSTAEGYQPDDVLWVPKQDYQVFHDDLTKSLKDIGGIPQGNLDKIFYDYEKIERCFVPTMKSVYFCIKADARMAPYELIWKQIRDELFVKSGNSYHFYYKPRIPRVFHIDQSISNDMTAIAFCHVERKPQIQGASIDVIKDIIYVIDFVVPIHPFGGRINLDAVREFITDIYTKGGIPIIKGSFDTFQSEASIQHLERYGIEMDHVSVDDSLDPYMTLAQVVEQGNLKLGRNIFFKNNLRSLRMSSTKIAKKLKIDHSLGDTINPSGADYAWDTSLLGINAKDISDAVAGAIYNAKMNLATDGTNLLQIWDEENIILTPEQLKTRSLNLVKEMGFLLPSHA
jgi:hypothetical protein